MPQATRRTIIAVALVAVLAWYSFWLAKPVNLATADLGRHITNGQIIFEGPSEARQQLLKTNFYSYTNADFPFVNHHWGSGVIFYLASLLGGITAVHLLYIITSLLTLAIIFDLSRRRSNTFVSTILTIILVPLIAARVEVRPEAFSYLFASIFLWVLWQYQAGTLNKRWLYLLPAIQLLWTNMHIYFLVGLGLIGAFLLETVCTSWLAHRRWHHVYHASKPYGLALFFSFLASLVNPFFAKTLSFSASIFSNYGYRVVENQSILFLENWGMSNPNYLAVKILTALLALGLLSWAVRKKELPVAIILISATFGTLAWLAIRNFSIFGLVSIPILAASIHRWPWQRLITDRPTKLLSLAIVLLVISTTTYFYYFTDIQIQRQVLGIGAIPEINAAADFIHDQNITGPIFNNYDIGGYLIYHFYPALPVFVDNRPEAYPTQFFEQTYIPMQEDDQTWQEQLAKHKFQAIVFWQHDLTPWAQQFLQARLNDPDWSVVFYDDYNIILTPHSNSVL